MCSLASSAVQSPPVEELLVAAPHPCFEASEIMVISTSPRVIGLDADSIESIHHLISSLHCLDMHILASKFHLLVLRAVVEGSIGNARETRHYKSKDLGYFPNSRIFAVKQVSSCLFWFKSLLRGKLN